MSSPLSTDRTNLLIHLIYRHISTRITAANDDEDALFCYALRDTPAMQSIFGPRLALYRPIERFVS